MDLSRLIKRVEKYLGRDLQFSMREFKQLQELKADILKIEELLRSGSSNSAILIEHYKDKSKHDLAYVERIERRLNVWVRRLKNLLVEEEKKLSQRDKQYFELFKQRIDVCKNNLIRLLAWGGELHRMINEPRFVPDTVKIRAKIDEALGDDRRPGLRTLLDLFQHLAIIENRLKSVPQRWIKEPIGSFKVYHRTTESKALDICEKGVLKMDNLQKFGTGLYTTARLDLQISSTHLHQFGNIILEFFVNSNKIFNLQADINNQVRHIPSPDKEKILSFAANPEASYKYHLVQQKKEETEEGYEKRKQDYVHLYPFFVALNIYPIIEKYFDVFIITNAEVVVYNVSILQLLNGYDSNGKKIFDKTNAIQYLEPFVYDDIK